MDDNDNALPGKLLAIIAQNPMGVFVVDDVESHDFLYLEMPPNTKCTAHNANSVRCHCEICNG